MPRTGSNRVEPNNSTLIPALTANDKAVLVSVHNHQVVTTSLCVAEYFGKEHSKVLRAIRMLDCSVDFNQANFGLVTYQDAKGEQRPMYYLTRDGFTFLAMGFTGKVAAQFKEAYIKAFDDMEKMLRKQECTKHAERLLKARVKAFNKCLAEGIAGIRKRHGVNYGPAGDLHGAVIYMNGRSFEDNLRNILAQIQCAYLDGYFFAGEAVTASKKLEEVKAATWELLSKL